MATWCVSPPSATSAVTWPRRVVAAGGALTHLDARHVSLGEAYIFISRRPEMQREGSPFKGVTTIALKEAADHMSSARMHLVMLLVLLTAARRGLCRHRQYQGHDGRGSFPVPQAVHRGAGPVAVLFLIHGLFAAAGGDRPGVRCGQWRVRAAHHEPHPWPSRSIATPYCSGSFSAPCWSSASRS